MGFLVSLWISIQRSIFIIICFNIIHIETFLIVNRRVMFHNTNYLGAFLRKELRSPETNISKSLNCNSCIDRASAKSL